MSDLQTVPLPQPKGPYSSTLRAGGFLFVAGQGGLDTVTGSVVVGGIEAQTRQTLINVEHLLHSEGYGLEDLVQVTCYMTNLDEWPRMNQAYSEMFGERSRPTRTAVEVANLPFDLALEVTCVAYREGVCG